jgi:hypothetical protein
VWTALLKPWSSNRLGRFLRLRRLYPLLLLALAPSAGTSLAATADSGAVAGPVVAVVPFADYTGQSVVDSILPLLQSRLEQKNIRLIPVAGLRDVLRSFRIRSAGMIAKEEVAHILSVRPVDFFLLGSIDVYIEGAAPEAAFSLRLVRASDMRIVWAISAAGNGEDFAGIFGLGRINSMPVMLSKLMDSALEDFDDAVSSTASADGPTAALAPFDNLTANRFAGDIFASVVLSELVARGVTVVEPGQVYDLFRRNNRQPAGGIDDDLMHRLHDSLGVELVITGTIDRFQPGTAGGEIVDPEIALGARCLEAATGKITATFETARRGSDSERFFKSGAYRSLGRMAQEAARTMLDELLRKKT